MTPVTYRKKISSDAPAADATDRERLRVPKRLLPRLVGCANREAYVRILPAHLRELALKLRDARPIEPRGEAMVGKDGNRQKKEPDGNIGCCSQSEITRGDSSLASLPFRLTRVSCTERFT